MNRIQFAIVMTLACITAMVGCHTGNSGNKRLSRHQVVLQQPGASLYVDKVDSKRIIREEKKGGNSHFVAYKVGFYDSTLVTDQKQKDERRRYYQYELHNDWKAVIQGDSLVPVFYHPETSLNDQVNEGILVFELPADKYPESLVYQDATGIWNTRTIDLTVIK